MSSQPADQTPSAALPFAGMRAIGITVADLAATADFYRKDLPFAEAARFTVPVGAFGPDLVDCSQGEVEIVLVEVATGMLQLMQFSGEPHIDPPPPVEGPGYTHICWQSPASDPALAKLVDRGLVMVSRCGADGVDLGGYGVRYAYGRDSERRMIEVEILDQPHRAGNAWVAHLANVVHDHDGMLDFYTRLTGEEPFRVLKNGGGRKTHDDVTGFDDVRFHGGWFRVRNMDIEVWQFLNPATPPPLPRRKLDRVGYNAPLFEVADLEAELGRLDRLGVPLVGPQIDLGGALTQYASDPEGNLFAVQQLGPKALGGSVARFSRT